MQFKIPMTLDLRAVFRYVGNGVFNINNSQIFLR